MNSPKKVQAAPGGRYDRELKKRVSWWKHDDQHFPRTTFPAGSTTKSGKIIDLLTGEVDVDEAVNRFGYPARHTAKYPTDLRYPGDPHAQEVHELGGKLIRPPLPSRTKFGAELAAHAPGCGSPIHVAGTNGGTMRCGSILAGERQFCGHCSPTIHENAVELVDLILDGKVDPADLKRRHAIGVEVEGEHTDDPKKKDQIAREHEAENEFYYPATKKPKGKKEALRWVSPKSKAEIMPGGSLGGTGDTFTIGVGAGGN